MSTSEDEIKRLLERTEDEVSEQYKPMSDLTILIVKTAAQMRDETALILLAQEQNPAGKDAYILFQSLWFCLHIAIHQILRVLPSIKEKEAVEYLAFTIPNALVEAHFPTFTEEQKSGIKSDCVDQMNAAETIYSNARREFSVFGYSGLFVKLARLLIECCGEEHRGDSLLTALVEVIERVWKRYSFRLTGLDFKAFYKEGTSWQS